MTTKLEDIYNKHREWLYIKDTDVIDLKLAMIIARRIHFEEGEKPVWMIFVAPSGSAKSEFLRTLLLGMPSLTYDLPSITTNTLVSGLEEATDLAPLLHRKLVIVLDASRFLSMRPDEKAIIFSQLRDLFDGFAGRRTGGTKSAQYKDLRVSMLWAAVPRIENEIIFHGNLGTRFLMYRYEPPQSRKAMEMMLERGSKGKIEQLQQETGDLERKLCVKIIREKRWEKIDIEKAKNDLMQEAEELAVMRATANIDPYNRIPDSLVDKEEPTRSFGQSVLLYKALRSLDKNYSHEKAMNIIEHVAISSGDRLRAKILRIIKHCSPNPVSTYEIGQNLRISYLAIRPQCYILWHLRVIDKVEKRDEDGSKREVEAWQMNPKWLRKHEGNVKK